MELTVNDKIIDLLKAEGFYPDEMFSMYFVLKALATAQVSLLDKYDDDNSTKRAMLVYQTLYRKGLVEKETESRLFFKLTNKGILLVESIAAYTNEPVVETKKAVSDGWIDEWINLFPVKASNRLLRGDKRSCLTKMNTFLKTNPQYTKEIVFDATKSYLIDQSQDSFKYTKNAVYFINKKDEGSQLAAWCKLIEDKIKSGGKLNDGTHLKRVEITN